MDDRSQTDISGVLATDGVSATDISGVSATVTDGTVEKASEPITKRTRSRRFKRFPKGPIISLIVLVVIFAVQNVSYFFAYFQDSESLGNNKIMSGSMDISIIEVSEDGNYYWTADPVRMIPAGVYNYGGVGVQNNGTIPVYARIKVEKTILRSEHEISPGWEELISCNFMSGGSYSWIYHEGYYYYKHALLPGEQTTTLFDTVFFAPEMGNEFENSSIQFKLICQSVQASGNSPDPTTAWGWPVSDSQSR